VDSISEWTACKLDRGETSKLADSAYGLPCTGIATATGALADWGRVNQENAEVMMSQGPFTTDAKKVLNGESLNLPARPCSNPLEVKVSVSGQHRAGNSPYHLPANQRDQL